MDRREPPSQTSIAPDAVAAQRREIRRVHRQHVKIGVHIQDLTERLDAVGSPARSDPARSDIIGRLARLQSELAEHFAAEEHVGFLPRALARAPRLARRARGIVSQHDLLRIQLAKVVTMLERASTDWQGLRERFAEFTEALRDHELRENELINEALMDDLGGG